jgi:glycosyltransferase involved in cell wall biosynthesis
MRTGVGASVVQTGMSIIHVVPSVAEKASGPTYSVVRLCESLIEHGQQVMLATLDEGPMVHPAAYLRRFEFGLGPQRLGRSPAMKRWLDRELGSGKVEIVHNHSLWMMPNVYPGTAARRYGVPLVVSPRGTLSEWAMRSGSPAKRLFWPLVQRKAVAAAKCLHATSEGEYRDIRRWSFRQPVCIIPNGIDLPPVRPRAGSLPRTLLFMGRIHPIKGLDLLLEAWREVSVRFPDWRLRIIGPDSGGYLDKVLQMARRLQLARVVFEGPIYRQAKHEALGDADLFILPSRSENFGVTVAEALAAGTPAIVSRGAPWAGLEANGAGWWCEIGVAPLVACLESALATPPAALREMGRRGRRWM